MLFVFVLYTFDPKTTLFKALSCLNVLSLTDVCLHGLKLRLILSSLSVTFKFIPLSVCPFFLHFQKNVFIMAFVSSILSRFFHV